MRPLRLVVAIILSTPASLTLLSLAPKARADTFIVSIVQSGNNVVATGNGALSVSGSSNDGNATAGVQGSPAYLILGGGQNTIYSGVSGPMSIGGSTATVPTSFTGGEVGFGYSFHQYVVPFGYIAGSTLASSDTWDSATLNSLGLTVGSYTYTFRSSDTFVINVGLPASITPEPSSLVLLGTGLLGAVGVVRRRFA